MCLNFSLSAPENNCRWLLSLVAHRVHDCVITALLLHFSQNTFFRKLFRIVIFFWKKCSFFYTFCKETELSRHSSKIRTEVFTYCTQREITTYVVLNYSKTIQLLIYEWLCSVDFISIWWEIFGRNKMTALGRTQGECNHQSIWSKKNSVTTLQGRWHSKMSRT